MRYYFYHGGIRSPLHGNAAIFGVFSAAEDIDPAAVLSMLGHGLALERNVDAAAIEIDQFDAIAWTPPPQHEARTEDPPPEKEEEPKEEHHSRFRRKK